MTIVGFDHVQLAMPPGGEAAARRFYGELLRLDERPKPEPLARRGGCWFENAHVQLHLGIEADFRPATKAHPALVVDDRDALARRLGDAGHPTRAGDPVNGVTQLFVEDPFGNRIELVDGRPRKFDFATIADCYDRARALSSANRDAWRAAFAAAAPPHRPLDSIDIGAGTGRFCELLADLFEGRVWGVEPSAAMRAKARAAVVDPRVGLVAGSAESLPLADASCDVVLLFLVWQHLGDHNTAAREIARVLRPGGVVLLHSSFSDRIGERLYFRWFPRCRTIEQVTQPSLADTNERFAAAGLELAEVSTVRHQAAESLRDEYERLRGRPFSTLHLLSDEEFRVGLAALEEEAGQERSPAPFFDNVELAVFRKA